MVRRKEERNFVFFEYIIYKIMYYTNAYSENSFDAIGSIKFKSTAFFFVKAAAVTASPNNFLCAKTKQNRKIHHK